MESKLAILGFLAGVVSSVTSVGYWSGGLEAKTDANMKVLQEISLKVDSNNAIVREELKDIHAQLSTLQVATHVNATLIQGKRNG